MSETFECPTCGYRWQQGQHGGHSCSDRLLQQLKDAKIELNSVLVDWNAIVSASGSKTHGGAVGHVAQTRAELEAVKAEREELKNELGGWEATIRSYVPEKYNANETALCAVENYISDLNHDLDSLRAHIEAAEKQEPFACYVGEGFIKYPAMNIASIKKAAKKFGYEFAELYKLPPMPAQQPNWKAEAKRAFWAGLEMGAAFGACAILPKWEEYIAKRESEMAQSNDFESGDGE